MLYLKECLFSTGCYYYEQLNDFVQDDVMDIARCHLFYWLFGLVLKLIFRTSSNVFITTVIKCQFKISDDYVWRRSIP